MSVRINQHPLVRRPIAAPTLAARRTIVLCAAVAALPVVAEAANITWDGEVDSKWNTPANWDSGTVPNPVNDTIYFKNGGNGNTTIDLGGTTYASNEKTITFDTDQVAAYTIGSGAIGSQTLVIGRAAGGGGNSRGGHIAVTASVVNDQTFNANVQLGAEGGSWTNNITNNSTNATLTFNGAILFSGTGKGLAFQGPGDIVINGFLRSTYSPTITKNGSGTTYLNHTANENTGTVRIQDGVLEIKTIANYNQASSLGKQTSDGGAGKLLISGGRLRFAGDSGGVTDRLFTLGHSIDGAPSVIDSSGSAPLQFTATGAVEFVVNTSASTSGSTASGSTTINVSNASRLAVGMSVDHGSIPANTVITGINGNQITISQATSASIDSGTSLTFGGGSRALMLAGTNAGDNRFTPILSDIGSVSGSAPAVTSLIKAESGTWTLLGANTYSGPTSIRGGILRLGASGVLPDASPVEMAGGTLAAGGVTETAGVLHLLANSAIDLGGGDTILSFADSSAVSWTAGAILDILNWDGDLAGGGNDQLFVGTSLAGLLPVQLEAIRFINPAGLPEGTYGAKLLVTGELVVVPEPAAGLLALLAPVSLLRRSRRAARAGGVHTSTNSVVTAVCGGRARATGGGIQ